MYQEEKLAFFSNLKKIRDLHENLIKEVSPNDAGVITLNEEIIKAEFEKVYNALEVRKKQLLEDVEVQKKRKLKESLIWKRMKEVHKKTIENVLNDCEKLLHEYDPQRFLEVACNLNQRMKTQLDLMQIACSHENQSECKQVQLDTTDIVNDILALSLTADIPSRDVEHSTSASPENKLQVKENVQNTFYPVPGENIVSLSAATEFGRISHEEMRYNYYMKNQVCLDERETQTSPQNENHLLLKSLPSKSTIPGHVSPWFHAEAKNEKFKVATLQRPCFSKAGLSNSFGFTFNVQAMNLNFCSSKNNLNLHSVNHSQNDAKEASLSALRNSCQNSTKPLQLNAVTLPSEGLFSFSVFPKLSGATAVATANPHVLGAAAGHSASPLIFGPSKESAQIFEKEKPRSVSLAKFERLHGNIKKSGTTISGNPFLTTFPNNSDSDPCQTATVNSSQEKSFSYLIADQKIFQENKAICFRKLSNKDNSWLTSSATDSNNHLFRNSNDAFPITGTISTSTASYMIVAPEKQPVADSGSSKSECCTNNTPFLFSFNGTTQNYGGSLTSIEPFKNTECTTEKSKMNNKDKKLTVQKPVPFVAACKEWEDTRSSFASINKGPIAETCSPFVPQHAIAHDFTANSALVSVEPPKSENPLEIPPPTIDHRAVNSDSDVEDLSQASIVSDSSSTSEYFSVSEDKISS